MARKKICSAIGQAFIVGLMMIIGLGPTQAVIYAQGTTPPPATTGTQTTPEAQTTDNRWLPPIAFERNGWFPDITTDATGRVHLAWSNSVINVTRGATGNVRQGYDVVLYTSSPDGVQWSTINEVAALRQTVLNNVEVTRPAMLVDKNGRMHMTYRDMDVYYSQAPVQTVDLANSWDLAKQINTNGLAYFSRMAEDSEGRLHMVYTEDIPTTDCLICYHLMYRNSDNGGKDWSTEADISVVPTGAAKPQILVDDNDNIHVVWESGRGGTLGQLADPTDVMYTVSYNRGQSWSSPMEISAPEGTELAPAAERAKNITIGQDGKGNLVIVWWSLPEDLVYYQVSLDNGLSWLQPQRLPNVWGIWANYNSRLDCYSMATDSAGNLHLVMVGRTGLEDIRNSLLHLTWDGSAWSAPETIVSYDGDGPEWPRIAISNGNQLNVTWFVRPEDFIWVASVDYYKIWFSRAKINAPYVGPQEYPTPLPPTLEAPTVVPTDQALDTPYPTQPPLNATLAADQIGRDTYSEMGQLSLLAVALVPTFLLVGCLLAVILIRRR